MSAHTISCECPRGVPDEPGMARIDLALPGVDQHSARVAAEKAAVESLGEVMLLAWHDGKAGVGYPDVPECSAKPSWFAYGVGHGAKLMVAVNGEEWVFLFLPLEQP